MIDAFFGKKLRPTRVFDEAGNSIPVTEIAVTPGTVVQVKTTGNDGYSAIQVGFDWKKGKNVAKPLQGHIKKAGNETNTPGFLREIQVSNTDTEYKPNDTITIDQVFKVGDLVVVNGISKAKGFQGGVRRHGFKGGSKTHGQSDRERAPGSIGQTTTPGRVYKGKRMAGHMGGERVSIKGLTVVGIDTEKNVVQIKGLIPGQRNMLVEIHKQ